MGFEGLEDKIRGLRNIVGADALRRKTLEQEKTIAQYQEAMIKKDEQHEKELGRKDSIIKGLGEQLRKEASLRIKYEGKEYSYGEIEAIVQGKLDEKIHKKIKEEAAFLFLKKKGELVAEEIKGYPHKSSEATHKIIQEGINREVDKILYDRLNWPPRFQDYVSSRIEKEVERRKTRDYYRSIETEASKKLEALKQGEWNTYLNNFLEKVVKPFIYQGIREQILSLTVDLETSCPKCGNINQVTPSTENLAYLLTGQNRKLSVECQYCRGFFGQTNYPLSLGDIFWAIKREN